MDVSKLATYLERTVHDDTCVIVASCPGAKMAEVCRGSPLAPAARVRILRRLTQVEPIITQFKKEHRALKANVQLGYCQKEGANKFL